MKGKDFKQAKASEGTTNDCPANLAQGSAPPLGAALVVADRVKAVSTDPVARLTKTMMDSGWYTRVVKVQTPLNPSIYVIVPLAIIIIFRLWGLFGEARNLVRVRDEAF